MAATEVKVPNIGDFKDIPVIELLVKAGDTVQKDDSLLVLESDKATLEVPSPAAGVIAELKVKIGDKVSAGTLVALLEGSNGAAPAVTNGNGKAKPAAAPAAAATSAAPKAVETAAPPALRRRPSRLPLLRRPPRRRRRRRLAPSPMRAPACAGSRASWACRSVR